MAHLFRTPKIATGPDGIKGKVLDAKGRPELHPRWRFEYTDHAGRRKIGTGTDSRAETERLAHQIELRELEIKRGLRPVPKSADKAAARSFRETAAEYCEWGAVQGGRGGRPWGATHLRMRRAHLAWWAERLSLATLADLAGALPKVEAALRELDAAGRSGKTLSNTAESLRGFVHWAKNRGYLDADPLEHLARFDCSPRTRRRAMTPEEIRALLDSAPPGRRLLYETALATGLRAGELRGLVVRDLDPDRPALHVRAEIAKSRKPATQPLPAALWERLKAEAADSPPDAALLYVPSHPARELDADLEAAGVRKWTPEGKVDFHGCRVAFCTLLLESGADVKTCQTLARHSTPDLTVNTYGRARASRLSEAAEAVAKTVFFGPEYTISPQRKVVGLENPIDSRPYPKRDAGSIPAASTNLRTNRT